MASVKASFLLVLVFAIGSSSALLDFWFMYSLIPYSAMSELDGAWKICSDNNTFYETKYKDVLKEAHKCYDEFTQSNQSICHSLKLNVQKCSRPLVNFFIDCLPKRSKDLPSAILKGAVSVVETFCTSTGEILVEVMNSCLYEYVNQHNKTIKESCKKETFQPKLDKFEVEIPSKLEACRVVREIGDCWQEYVNQDCESSKAREFFSIFYKAATSACKI